MDTITQIFFDDALQDTYENRHLLDNFQGEKYISVPTGFVGKPITWKDHKPFGELALTINQLKTMISEGWKIASHGVSHEDLTQWNPSAQSSSDQMQYENYELEESKKWIKENLGVEPEIFVFPYDKICAIFQRALGYHLFPL